MAIFGPTAELKDQWPQGVNWAAAREIVSRYLTDGSEERVRAFSRAEGEGVKLDVSNELFIIEECYLTRESAEVRWEAHREWADVQVILAGEEKMEVAKVGNLTIKDDLSPQRDTQFSKLTKKVPPCDWKPAMSRSTCRSMPIGLASGSASRRSCENWW